MAQEVNEAQGAQMAQPILSRVERQYTRGKGAENLYAVNNYNH
jgi:hypothetical protein